MSSEVVSPNDFFDHLRKRVRDQLSSDFDQLGEDLQQRYKSLKGAKDSGVSSKIKECTNELYDRLELSYMRNIEKVRVYCTRNLFLPSRIMIVETAENQDIEITNKANEAKERYSKVKLEHDVLLQEIREMETLLKEMRGAMFDLRVGSQTFEDLNLVESVARLAEHQTNLEALCDKSQAIIDQLNASQPQQSSSSHHALKPQSLDTSINAGDLSDIMALSHSLR